MNFVVGQRWRWIYTSGSGSDLILEVINESQLKIVQVIKPYGPEDYVNRVFNNYQVTGFSTAESKLEYLEGQDKPL